MKSKFVILSTVLLMSVCSFAQKNQIKAAQGELNSGNPKGALATLKSTEYLIVNAKDEDKSDFYFLKAKVLTTLASNNVDSSENLSLAVLTYEELITEEVASGNLKYAVQARAAIKEIKSNLENSAIADSNSGKFADCAGKMYYLYQMDKKDTLKLFYAASNYLNAKNYDLALKNYKELAQLNYSGKGLEYYATNKKTKTEELFTSVAGRDASVKEGTHEKSRNFMAPSKRTEIYKNMGYIYSERGDLDNAEICYKKILESDPKNLNAYIDLAYLKQDSRKKLVDEMSALGTTAKDMKVYEELKVKKDEIIKSAVFYLEKANQIDSKNVEVSKMLLNSYRALDMTTEYNALKARM